MILRFLRVCLHSTYTNLTLPSLPLFNQTYSFPQLLTFDHLLLFVTFELAISKAVNIGNIYILQKKSLLPIV